MKLLLPLVFLVSTAAAFPLPLATGNVADLSIAIGPLEERTMSPDNVTTEPTIRDIAYVDTGTGFHRRSGKENLAGPERRSSAGPERRTTADPERRTTTGPERRTTITDERDTTMPEKRVSADPERRTTAGPERRSTTVDERETDWGRSAIVDATNWGKRNLDIDTPCGKRD